MPELTSQSKSAVSREEQLIAWIEQQRATDPKDRLTPRMEANYIAGLLGLRNPDECDRLRAEIRALAADLERAWQEAADDA